MKSRQAGTNAADSAPGVDDGPATGRAVERTLGPGRRRVWLGVAAVLALLAVIFLARPAPDDGERAIGPAMTQSEIENSTVPGASNPAPAPAR